MMKLVSAMTAALLLAFVAPPPSHAATVSTDVIFFAMTEVSGGEGVWVVLSSEDPRCEHGRLVRYETRGNNSAAWKSVGQDATKQSATAAFWIDPNDVKSQSRANIVAKTLSDGTQCKAKVLDLSKVRNAPQTLSSMAALGGAPTGLLYFVGGDFLPDGSIIQASAIQNTSSKCRSRRLVIIKIQTAEGTMEIARDTTDAKGLMGVDFTFPPVPFFLVAPKRILGDGTVCPMIADYPIRTS